MGLVSVQKVQLGFGGAPLLSDINLQIEKGERVCLLGRNGTGKSTLLKLISGVLEPDQGIISRSQKLKLAYLSQEISHYFTGTTMDVVFDGLHDSSSLLDEYNRISGDLATDRRPQLLNKLDTLQQELEVSGVWMARQQAETVMTELSLDPKADFQALSGGLKRRVLLARALVGRPDLLLLDEPTNHLDIDSIGWLEKFLLRIKSTLLFITHDRVFLQNMATRIVELERGRLKSWPGDYRDYLIKKQHFLESERKNNVKFDKKLAQEEIWLRQGVKARRTRNEGRVRKLFDMREDRRKRRAEMGKARIKIQEAKKSGKLVVEAKSISFSYDSADEPVVKDFSTIILRGDKVGLIGKNGCGKTTLLRLLLGELSGSSGSINLGTHIEIAYLDQLRDQLEEDKNVIDNIVDGGDRITVNGKTQHIIGYLQDFLFLPERARTPVSVLSGGEKNRLLLAKLFSKPSNVLVFDEPTNDLDYETLELLEEKLMHYKGTVLLVSHDRAFLNNVVTSTLVFEGSGHIQEYIGGYDDWLLQQQVAPEKIVKVVKKNRKRTTQNKPRTISFKEKQELLILPQKIEALEKEEETCHQSLADPNFYKTFGSDKIVSTKDRIEVLKIELEECYERWEFLEDLQSRS